MKNNFHLSDLSEALPHATLLITDSKITLINHSKDKGFIKVIVFGHAFSCITLTTNS